MDGWKAGWTDRWMESLTSWWGEVRYIWPQILGPHYMGSHIRYWRESHSGRVTNWHHTDLGHQLSDLGLGLNLSSCENDNNIRLDALSWKATGNSIHPCLNNKEIYYFMEEGLQRRIQGWLRSSVMSPSFPQSQLSIESASSLDIFLLCL